jgi:hypothetical protein
LKYINQKILNELTEEQYTNILKLIVQYNIEQNEYYNPNTYIKLILNQNIEININLDNFKNKFEKYIMEHIQLKLKSSVLYKLLN